MSVDMYVSASQNQASSVSTMCKSQVEGYNELQKAITDFNLNAPFLTGKAYDSAKAYFSSVLYPLAQGGILLSEAVEKAVKKFPEEYISQVDSGDLKQSELEEKIRRADRLLNQAEDIRRELNSSKTPDITKSFQLNANSMLIGMYSASKQKLEEQLRKLLAFNASSPTLFSEIAGLQSAVNSGLAQTKTAWNGATGTFTVPKDLTWKDTISQNWKLREKNEQEILKQKIKNQNLPTTKAEILRDYHWSTNSNMYVNNKTGVPSPEVTALYSKLMIYSLVLQPFVGAWAISKIPQNQQSTIKGNSNVKSDFGAENPVSGNDWNNYFKDKYGAANVQWKPTSLNDVIVNPERLYGCTKNEVQAMLGEGWIESTYGSAGTGWKFTNTGDGMVFYHPGEGIHGGSYYGFSTGDTGKVKIVGEDYIDFSDDKATVIKYGGE